ncbi:MAG TPA: N-6 DNA methylase [Bacilli bacterium]|nr:N-6 DNA methylase [Bacilli bacterium]HQA55883.1 N-6 DNA methylase [Bacilli bacterium]
MTVSTKDYYKIADKKKVKKLGQFFTPCYVADFMRRWILGNNPKSILDPAVGNGIFLAGIDDSIHKVGYDIDKEIIEFFKQNNHMNYEIRIEDFLIDHWDESFDSIICNPPYNKFQTLDNREEVYLDLKEHLKIPLSGYSNQYVLFLLKSIKILNKSGRLAFIIPNEFLNTGYGKVVKKFLIREHCLKGILSFDNSKNIFEDALTTACIVLVEKSKLNEAFFAKIDDIEELSLFNFDDLEKNKNIRVKQYDSLNCDEKWLSLFEFNTKETVYKNLVPFSNYARVKRGIATGDNEFFVFNKSKIKEYGISKKNLIPCATKCADFKYPLFDESDFEKMEKTDVNCYVFDGSLYSDKNTVAYIKYGESIGTNKKYLTSHRDPWYGMESKEPSPIWINVFSRQKLKVVRNLAGIKNLTTFHSVYMNSDKDKFTDVLFCYLLTDLGQSILYQNKRSYGGGLDKFEPGDLNDALILDFGVISQEDTNQIVNVYNMLHDKRCDFAGLYKTLEQLFAKYLL